MFETAIFDESKFAIGIPTVRLSFNWLAHQPATFEIRIPKQAITRSDDVALVEEAVNYIKATGVRAVIKIVDG